MGGGAGTSLMAMTMLAVHEKVHQRTGEKQDVGQYSEHVRPVFPQHIKQRARCQANKNHGKDIFCAIGHRLSTYLEVIRVSQSRRQIC